MSDDPGGLFDRLGRSEFSTRFRLRGRELGYLRREGLGVVPRHASDFVEKRRALAHPS